MLDGGRFVMAERPRFCFWVGSNHVPGYFGKAGGGNNPCARGFLTGMNKLTNSLLVLAVGGLLFAGSAAAQTSNTSSGAGPGVVDPGHPRVNEVNGREGIQQQRIANGIQNGTLNSKQAANLENRETALQNREQKDMAKNGGHLTKAEQTHLNQRENRISRSIARDKASNQ